MILFINKVLVNKIKQHTTKIITIKLVQQHKSITVKHHISRIIEIKDQLNIDAKGMCQST